MPKNAEVRRRPALPYTVSGARYDAVPRSLPALWSGGLYAADGGLMPAAPL